MSALRSAHQRGLAWLGRSYGNYLIAVDASPRRAAYLLALACLPLALLATLLWSHLRAGIEDLLPKESPAVAAVQAIHERFPGRASLMVVATSPDTEVNRKFIATLGERLVEQHIPEARRIQWRCQSERQWLSDHAALLMPEADFVQFADALDEAAAAAHRAANPLFVDLDGPPETGPEQWRQILAQFEDQQRRIDRFPAGWFEGEDGHLVLALVWLEGSETEREPAERLVEAVHRAVEAIRPAFPPGLRVGYSGEAANLVEEYHAVASDLVLSSALVLTLVSLLIAFHFRSLAALVAVMVALMPGLLLASALGFFTVGHINSNTGFLGSIIAGNGINYPLLFLAYYHDVDRARPTGRTTRAEALLLAARRSLPGTLGAALTAAAAYGALATSTFRGFSQFGWLGGAGMLCVWAATYVAMPIAIALLDPPRPPAGPATRRDRLAILEGGRRPVMVAAVVITASLALAAVGIRFALAHGVWDTDLRNLASRDSQRSGSQSWGPRLSPLFGIWISGTTALVDDPLERPALVAALHEALFRREPRLGASLEVIDKLAPAASDQARRIARLRRIATVLEQVPREAVPATARPLLDAWLDKENLRVIEPSSVPASLAANLAERNGRTDRTVVVFPRSDIDFNDARNLIEFARRLERAQLPAGAQVGGSFVLMAEVFRVVSSEAPRVVAVAALLVAALLVPLFHRRPSRILWVTALVAVVALVSQAQMLGLGVQVNMVNFAATPITIGVGADYLINLLGAMDSLDVDALRARARLGGTILICSLTTMVGYASLLLAESGALRTFGWAAALGECMAVTTVLLVLPALWPSHSRAQALTTTQQAEVQR